MDIKFIELLRPLNLYLFILYKLHHNVEGAMEDQVSAEVRSNLG